jgi:Domain of unknown function (DUF4159)
MLLNKHLIVATILGVLGLVWESAGQSRNHRLGRDTGEKLERGEVPEWAVNDKHPFDLFTFARLKYPSIRERQSLAWYTDYADADLWVSFRLHELTSIYVHPEPKLVTATDPDIAKYPWIFMSGVGSIALDHEEAQGLRKYLLGGGFILVDDFWGEEEWDNFYAAMKQVFPEREPVDLKRSHPIFHCVYDIPDDRPLQTPNINFAIRNKDTGITWERPDGRDVHFRAILDDKQRIMVFICHNTDNGDGWEEESRDPWFFREFSENKNYPLAVNIIFYAMTH